MRDRGEAMTKFRLALQETIEDHEATLNKYLFALYPAPELLPHCAFCLAYRQSWCEVLLLADGRENRCGACPMYRLCGKHQQRYARIRRYPESVIQLEITVLMYLHWLYDNKITERQMREVQDDQ